VPPAALPAQSEIIIDPVSNGECILNIPQTILAGAKMVVATNKKFKINGLIYNARICLDFSRILSLVILRISRICKVS